jgi:hypothetical protein
VAQYRTFWRVTTAPLRSSDSRPGGLLLHSVLLGMFLLSSLISRPGGRELVVVCLLSGPVCVTTHDSRQAVATVVRRRLVRGALPLRPVYHVLLSPQQKASTSLSCRISDEPSTGQCTGMLSLSVCASLTRLCNEVDIGDKS